MKPALRVVGALLFWAGLALTWLAGGCATQPPREREREAVTAVAASVATATLSGKGSGKARVRKANGDVVDLQWFDEWLAGQEVKTDVKVNAVKERDVDPGLPWWVKALAVFGGVGLVGLGLFIALRLVRR